MSYTEAEFEVINLGRNEPITLSHAIQEIASAIGVRPIINRLPGQPGDVSTTFADASKADRLLGYRPNTKFAEGIANFLDWLHRDGHGFGSTPPTSR